jgi:tetratricopeptide (TPR) repeat protein
MKKKLTIYMMAAVTLLAVGCEKKLDLANPQALDSATVFSTEDRVRRVLIGNYASLGAGSLFGGDVHWMSELMGSDGELNWVGTFPDPRQIWGKTIQTNNSNVLATYSAAYRVIFNCNNILGSLEVVSTANKNRVRGEALFLRAMAYFELIKFYGEKPYVAGNTGTLKGVPLITAPGPSAPQSTEYKLPRASVEEVYVQIIKDFSDAESLLPNTNSVYANKSAALLGLARVYLQQAKYPEARDAANRCLNAATGRSLRPNYADAFNNTANTTEDIFAMQVTVQVGTNSNFTYYSTGTFGARDGDIEVQQKHMNKYETGDRRKNLFFFEADAFRVGKWQLNFCNVKVMRLAEAYLTRAECNVRLGTAIGATVAADIKRIRDRVALPEIASPTLAQVLKERELELAFEGQGVWDAKRMKQSVDGLPWDDNRITFPIPLRERNINPSLTQNPGYN